MFCKLNVNDVCRSLGLPITGVDCDHVFFIYIEVFACLELHCCLHVQVRNDTEFPLHAHRAQRFQ